jgi:cytochrome c oxidase assembly factor CtaG
MELTWNLAPSVLIGMGIWTAAYVLTVGPLRRGRGAPPGAWRQAAFHMGTLVGLLALISPLDELGDEYLFSAHMVQHLLLLYVTAPCWLLGMPEWLPTLLIPERWLSWARRILRPGGSLIVFAGILLAWHMPAAYGFAQEHEAAHIAEHLMYIGAGLIGWWPIAGPAGSAIGRPSAPVRMLYLFAMALPCSFLGAMLTFAQTPLYGYYVAAPHVLGLGVLEDQRLGGLLMWVPTHMLLLGCLTIIGGQWLNMKEPTTAIPSESSISQGANLHE